MGLPTYLKCFGTPTNQTKWLFKKKRTGPYNGCHQALSRFLVHHGVNLSRSLHLMSAQDKTWTRAQFPASTISPVTPRKNWARGEMLD